MIIDERLAGGKERKLVGKFLKRNAIVDLVKSNDKTNSLQARNGGPRYHVDTIVCGCPDDNCGGWHAIRMDRPLPSSKEADETLFARRHPYGMRVVKRSGGR